MKRIYFLLPDIETAGEIVNELLLARIEERHIHIIANDRIPLGDLPEAGLTEKTDFIPALEKGMIAGGATGVVASLVALAFPAVGVAVAGGIVLGSGLAGAGLGAWISSMVGISIPNSRLERFHDAVESGQILMLVDVPRARVEEIEGKVKQLHPEASVQGTDPMIPAFP